MATKFNELALETIQSQYGASPRMVALVLAMAARLDPTADIDLFFDSIFNPKTAHGVGLDVWGRIVGISRMLAGTNSEFFGFSGSGLRPFNQAPFFLKSLTSGQFCLSDAAFRFLIFYKAMANISTETMADINTLLDLLFADAHGAERCFVLETGVMHIRAVFLFALTDYESAILGQYALLNRGAGVGFSYYQILPDSTFGFSGSGLQPFNQGKFNAFPEIDV